MLLYLCVGLVAGFFSGLLGIGGGVVMVPSLIFLLPREGFSVDVAVHTAFGTSLTSAFFLTLSSAVAHIRYGHTKRESVPYLAIGGVSGALIGSYLSSLLSGVVLRKLFACFLLFSAFRLAFSNAPSSCRLSCGRVALSVVGLVAGVVAAFFGVGGGVVAVPTLIFLGFPPVEAVGTSSALLPFVTSAAAFGYYLTGCSVSNHKWCMGYIYLPAVVALVVSGIVAAQIGALVSGHVPRRLLKRIFACLLVVVALKILSK